MKNKNIASAFFIMVMICFFSCQHDEDLTPVNGRVVFSPAPADRSNGRVMNVGTPAFVLLTTIDDSGKKQEDIKLSLAPFGQSYASDGLELQTGNYKLTQFFVLDSIGRVIYATPLEGSDLAHDVIDPLPMNFTVSENRSTQITMQVLPVFETDRPEKFGYVNFGFQIVTDNSIVKVKSRVVIKIGDVIYENLDATIRVTGYSSFDAPQWTKDYSFIGPLAILEVQSGYHHYSIELVDKWGIHDMQAGIAAKDMLDGRADGPHPVTYVLGGSKEAKRLSIYVSSREVSVPGTGIVYQPEFKVVYNYGVDHRLEFIHHELYNAQTSQFEENSVEAFTYEGDAVSKIITTMNGQLYKEDQYTYGTENKIMERLYYDDDILATETFTRNYDSTSVNVKYDISNGNSFSYAFDVLYKNIVKDQTTQGGGQVCSRGKYSYDKNINPFRHLGYVDFNLQNWSASNKVTEDPEYLACSFPTLIPVLHDYVYNKDGYPVKEITTYKAGSITNDQGTTDTIPYHNKIEFYYE